VSLKKENNKVYIEIYDSGSGIKKEIQEKIFDPFFTTKAPQKGTGLGLSLVHSIVDKNKAEISVDSEEGEYTRFSLTFDEAA